VVACPNCRVELDLDADDIGHRLECPACLTTFLARLPEKTPEAPPPFAPEPTFAVTDEPEQVIVPADDLPTAPSPSPPPAAPLLPPPPLPVKPKAARPSTRGPTPPAPPPIRRSNDPVVLPCPACNGQVSVSPSDLGHRVECPMCQQVFRAEDPDARRSSRRDRDDRDDDSWDDRRRRRSRSRSRYDDDDDRPRRRRYEDPYESPDPKAWVWQAKRDLASPGGGLEVLGWLDVVFGGLYILIGVLLGAAVGGGGGGVEWEMVALTIGLGVSGIAVGGVKAFGGRLMKQAKNLRFAFVACFAALPPINLIACLLVFRNPQYMITCCPGVLTFPAWIVSIVFAIIGLTKLFRQSVKKAFEVNRPGGDVDAV
jgi:uncharacterized protein YbaR (Trm112 family)